MLILATSSTILRDIFFMIKIRKRISVALLSSIVVHILVITALYISYSDTDTDTDTDKSTIHSTEKSVFSEGKTKPFPDKQLSSDSFEQSNAIKMNDAKPKLMTLTNEKEVLRLEDKDEKALVEADEVKTYLSTEAAVQLDKSSEQNLPNRKLVNRDKSKLSTASIKDRNLLSTDMPDELNEPEQIRNVDSLEKRKAEVEDINTQLSAAINEVKNRNQQRIDQLRQD